MPRLRPLPDERDDDPIIAPSAEPLPTEPIVINLAEDGEADAPVVIETETRVEKKDDDALQNALEATRRAEELARNAERQRDEAIRQARERDEELRQERGNREEAQYNSVLTAIAAEQANLQKAQSDYAAAASQGDWDAATAAQTALAKATSRLDRLEDNKQAIDSNRDAKPARVERTERQASPAPADFESRIAQFPDNAKAWLRTHPEFITDPAKTTRIGSVHNYLVDQKGIQAFSPAYFEALDAEFNFKASPEPKPTTQPKPRSMPMTAPVSREVPTGSGRSEASITLTPEEVQIARTSFGSQPGVKDLTNAQKELLYARNKAKLQAMRANGSYRQTTEQTG
jgi:hypothetical protein